MKAAVRSTYGPSRVLSIQEIPIPQPADNEIRVKVHASTVNRSDCAALLGKPLVMRLMIGFLKPTLATPGTEFAGEIDALGKAVTNFNIGDKVWGFNDLGLSTHAQYLVMPADGEVLKMSDKSTLEQAAASAEGAHYAINFINKVEIKAGQKILINGASGGIGSALLQIVKHLGAEITAVCNTKNLALIQSLGAERVIDYLQEDFTKIPEQFDFVFDAVGKNTFFKCKRLLKPGGIYISSELGPWWQNIYLALLTPIFKQKKVVFPIPSNIKASLNYIQDLIEKDAFQAVIDRHYPLDEIREAFEYVASGQKTGNVVIRCWE